MLFSLPRKRGINIAKIRGNKVTDYTYVMRRPLSGAISLTSKSVRLTSGWRCSVAMCPCWIIGRCATPTALTPSGWCVPIRLPCGRFWSDGLTPNTSLRCALRWLWRCAISSTKSGSTRFLSASTGSISGALSRSIRASKASRRSLNKALCKVLSHTM